MGAMLRHLPLAHDLPPGDSVRQRTASVASRADVRRCQRRVQPRRSLCFLQMEGATERPPDHHASPGGQRDAVQSSGTLPQVHITLEKI